MVNEELSLVNELVSEHAKSSSNLSVPVPDLADASLVKIKFTIRISYFHLRLSSLQCVPITIS